MSVPKGKIKTYLFFASKNIPWIERLKNLVNTYINNYFFCFPALAISERPSGALIPTRRQLSAIMGVTNMLGNLFRLAGVAKSAFGSASRRAMFYQKEKTPSTRKLQKKGKKKTFGNLAKEVITKITKASSSGLKQAKKLFEKAKKQLAVQFTDGKKPKSRRGK